MEDYEDVEEETTPNWLVEQWLMRNSVSTPSNPSLPSEDSLHLYDAGKYTIKEPLYEDIINVEDYKIHEDKKTHSAYKLASEPCTDDFEFVHTYPTYASLPVIYDGRRRKDYKKNIAPVYSVIRRSKPGENKRPIDAYSEVLDEIRGLSLTRAQKARSQYDELDSYTADLEETKSNFAMVLRELEQSELERREKEQERITAHESIIERDIRLQREREKELDAERQRKLGDKRDKPYEPEIVQQTQQRKVLLSPPVKESPPRSPSPGYNMQDTPNGTGKSGIGYEDAISTYAHQGESLIAKELREQKEREMELRKRWKEMGMESPLDPTVPDTPYNRPDPVQPPRNPMSRTNKSRKDTGVTSYSDLPNVKKLHHEKNLDTPRAHVQPYSDTDEDSTDAAQETPIEREIRLAQERENELRRIKGIVAEKIPAAVKLEFSAGENHPYHRMARSDTERGTIKRFAASRLNHEIQMEQQRENEMRREILQTPNSTDSTDNKPRSGSLTNGKSPKSVSNNYNTPVIKGDGPRDSKKLDAEARIQQELQEMREREEELRVLHGISGSTNQLDNGHLNNNYEMTAKGDFPQSKSMSSLSIKEKTPRRRSTLAEEWEKRVAAGNAMDLS